ncbi:MAG: hypothetical protein KGZ82_09500 [Bacteroidales bacterium]|nr:hypothetical protein [Bacteroidales bacterium]
MRSFLAKLVVFIVAISTSSIAIAIYPGAITTLTVKESGNISRVSEVTRSGVPLSKTMDIKNTDGLSIRDSATGQQIPAAFKILARWNSGLGDTYAPIQWLLVTFPVTISSNETKYYELYYGAPTNTTKTDTLKVTQNNSQIIVDTGAAVFKLGNDPNQIFDELQIKQQISPRHQTLIKSASNDSRPIVMANKATISHSNTRSIKIEHKDNLSAVIVIDGEYQDSPSVQGKISSSRRYVFSYGSPVAVIRHAVTWEGDLCPSINGWNEDISCKTSPDTPNEPNGVLIEKIRDTLRINDIGTPRKIRILTSDSIANQFNANIISGETAYVTQKFRENRLQTRQAEAGITRSSGINKQNTVYELATGGMLSISAPKGTIAAAINHMHQYDPQAISHTHPSSKNKTDHLNIDIADKKIWLGQRQGMFATFAIGGFGAELPVSDHELKQKTWAPLNHPLQALPSPSYVNKTHTLDEIPDLTTTTTTTTNKTQTPTNKQITTQRYDTHIKNTLTKTAELINKKGLTGLMTYGSFPRFWGNPSLNDEIDCARNDTTDNDPSPEDDWDDPYWCATWTDYHNSSATAAINALRTSDPLWLDEIAFPSAQRMLFTQIMQCSPDDNWLYCGQAPAGYGGYRSDFNSSHAYFENLQLYYWLTGDYTVVEKIKRGATSMRRYYCKTPPCQWNTPQNDEWATLTGRAAMQWNSVFRFLGLASDAPSFLDDWRTNLTRAISQYYVEATKDGVNYGFWMDEPHDTTTTPDQPIQYTTSQLWMASLYDMNQIYRFAQDTSNHGIVELNYRITPMSIISAWARTLSRFGRTLSCNNTSERYWPNTLNFTFIGNKLGGKLIDVTPNISDGDPCLYDSGKSAMTATILRAGIYSNDHDLILLGNDLVNKSLDSAIHDGSPLGKTQGIFLSRLHSAVYLLPDN